jgi:pyridoxine 4-dehydrogenase
MQLPGPGVFGPPRDRDVAIAVLRRAAELGVDHIDTAQFYGPVVANELIKAALYPYPQGLALVSKVGARRNAAGGVLPYDSPAELRQGIADNLRTLAVDHLAAVNLRLMDSAPPDQRFDDQLGAMIQAREEGLIGGIGLSNITREHLLHALGRTDIACVQNPLNLADMTSMPVLEECHKRGIAFAPFFPLGSAFARANPVLGNPGVMATAARLGYTPAQVALAWLLRLRPNVLLIPGTSSLRHLEENMTVANVVLDGEARQLLASGQ